MLKSVEMQSEKTHLMDRVDSYSVCIKDSWGGKGAEWSSGHGTTLYICAGCCYYQQSIITTIMRNQYETRIRRLLPSYLCLSVGHASLMLF